MARPRLYEHYWDRPCYQVEQNCKSCGELFKGRKRRKYCSHMCALRFKLRLGYLRPGHEPTKHPTMGDIRWAAGIYEGEGTVVASGPTKSSERIEVSQKDPWLLYKLCDLFGGNVRNKENNKRAHLQNGKQYTEISQWIIGGSRARGFMMTIYLLLSPRRQEQMRRVLWQTSLA